MSPSLKKVCIFGLAEGIGHMLLDQINSKRMPESDKEITTWNAQEMIRTGQAALNRCNVKIDRNMLRRSAKKIDQICKDGDEFVIVEMLSFLFLGLNDLSHFCKDCQGIIKQVEDAALNFTTLYDPNLEDENTHTAAMEKYQTWLNS